MIERRRVLWGLGGAAATLSTAEAKGPPKRTPRIGLFLGAGDRNDGLAQLFEAELKRRGFDEGKSIVIERRRPRANTDEIFSHAAELAALDLDVVASGALPFALAIRDVAPDLPQAIGVCPGMISNGFAKSLRRPGGVATGTEELPPGLTAHRLRLLKRVAPQVTQVALLSTTPGRGGHETQLADAEAAAPALGITVHPYRASSLPELQEALASIARDGMNGLVSFQGGLALANRKLIVGFAAENRIPAIYQSSWFADAGGLMSWSYDLSTAFRHQAKCVDMIVRGTPAGDIPIRYPRPYYLTVNFAAADALGVELPADLKAKAKAAAG